MHKKYKITYKIRTWLAARRRVADAKFDFNSAHTKAIMAYGDIITNKIQERTDSTFRGLFKKPDFVAPTKTDFRTNSRCICIVYRNASLDMQTGQVTNLGTDNDEKKYPCPFGYDLENPKPCTDETCKFHSLNQKYFNLLEKLSTATKAYDTAQTNLAATAQLFKIRSKA